MDARKIAEKNYATNSSECSNFPLLPLALSYIASCCELSGLQFLQQPNWQFSDEHLSLKPVSLLRDF